MVQMISSGPDMPPFNLESDAHAIRITDLSQNDLFSLIGPGAGLSGGSGERDSPRVYPVKGITGIDISRGISEGVVTVHLNSRGFAPTQRSNEHIMTRLDEWLTWHFTDLREAQQIASKSLRKSQERRSETRS